MRVLGFAQVRHACLGDEKRAARVDAEHQIEPLCRRLLDAAERQRAGVVDADIDAAERGDRCLDGARDLVLEADVARQRQRAAARRLDLGDRRVDSAFELGVRLLRLGDDGDVGAVTRRALGDGEADAAARPGDEQRLAGEPRHRSVSRPGALRHAW